MGQVPLILSHLMSDRRISRAAHPIINAWRCQVGPLVHQGTHFSLGGLPKVLNLIHYQTMTTTEKQLQVAASHTFCRS